MAETAPAPALSVTKTILNVGRLVTSEIGELVEHAEGHVAAAGFVTRPLNELPALRYFPHSTVRSVQRRDGLERDDPMEFLFRSMSEDERGPIGGVEVLGFVWLNFGKTRKSLIPAVFAKVDRPESEGPPPPAVQRMMDESAAVHRAARVAPGRFSGLFPVLKLVELPHNIPSWEARLNECIAGMNQALPEFQPAEFGRLATHVVAEVPED